MPHRLPLSWQSSFRHLLVPAAVGMAVALSGAAPSAAADKKPAAHAAAPKEPAAVKDRSQAAEQPPPSSPGASDPVVASVEGHQIFLSDLGRAQRALPANLRSMPFETLFPVLLNRVVDHEALVMLALRRGLEDRPEVKAEIQDATNRVLEAALLGLDAAPKVTEASIKARYEREYAHRPATEQVRASHILVRSKEEAGKLIAELKQGADFATLAEKYSLDPDGKNGGSLGFFNREQVWPGFADVAFSLEPGQVADEPVHNEFGWHVVKVDERRLVPPPALKDVHDALRDELMKEAISQEVALARGQLTIHQWNLDGSDMNPAMAVGSVAEQPK